MSDTKLEVVERYGGFSDEHVDHVAKRVTDLMRALGMNLTSEHFLETPRRVAAMLMYFSQDVDLNLVLKDGFETSERAGMIIQKHIPFKGLCAHHLLPFFGTAAVGYIPNGRVVGLSKLTRLVTAAGLRAPSTQETITEDIVQVLATSSLEPRAVYAVSKAVHGCMAVRGVNAPHTETIAFAGRDFGATAAIQAQRSQLFFQLIGSDW